MKWTPLRRQSLVRITDGLFLPSARPDDATVFQQPVLIEVRQPSDAANAFWAVTGPYKTQVLKVLAGQYIVRPPNARTFPLGHRILFLNFLEASGLDRTHLSARYETYLHRGALEMSDNVNSVLNYITGANNYNSNAVVDPRYIPRLLSHFDLESLQHKWINSLSNGQLRRARIAKALVSQPRLLLIDDPFLGLDPRATQRVAASIADFAAEFDTGVVLGLRQSDPAPRWVQQAVYADASGVSAARAAAEPSAKPARRTAPVTSAELASLPPHIEFHNASVAYKGVHVLRDFNWTVPRGSKWRILGDNGTGKTTILLLITADHPQLWRLVLSIDGQRRRTGSGASFFDINNKIGILSPELHALVPPRKTMRQVVMTGLARNVGNSNFMFAGTDAQLTAYGRDLLARFTELRTHGDTAFGDLSVTHQKLALFLRAAVANPQILILDEAFLCMDDPELMRRCHAVVAQSAATTLSIGHIDWELAHCDYVLKLQGGGRYTIDKYL